MCFSGKVTNFFFTERTGCTRAYHTRHKRYKRFLKRTNLICELNEGNFSRSSFTLKLTWYFQEVLTEKYRHQFGRSYHEIESIQGCHVEVSHQYDVPPNEFKFATVRLCIWYGICSYLTISFVEDACRHRYFRCHL